jgi:hypothetical protein
MFNTQMVGTQMAHTLNASLWIAQGLVAAVLALAGAAKLALSREKLAHRMHWAVAWPRWGVKLLGLAEVAGAVGLVAPRATGIAPVLTPITALCVAALMAGAVRTHRQLGEGFLPAVIVGALCLGIAAGRLLPGAQA